MAKRKKTMMKMSKEIFSCSVYAMDRPDFDPDGFFMIRTVHAKRLVRAGAKNMQKIYFSPCNHGQMTLY